MSKKNKAKPKRPRVAYNDLFWAPNEVEMRKQDGEKANYQAKGSVDEVLASDLSGSNDNLGGEEVRNEIFSDDDGEEHPSDDNSAPCARSGTGQGFSPYCYPKKGEGRNQLGRAPGSRTAGGDRTGLSAQSRIGENAGDWPVGAYEDRGGAQSRIGENAGDWPAEAYEDRGGAQSRIGENAGDQPVGAHNSTGSKKGKRTSVVEAGQQGENEEDQEENDETVKPSQIKNMGSVTAKTERGVVHCMTIIGQVEGHYILPPQNKTTKYEHIIPTLVAVEESPEIDGLLIMLNTVGGDVEAGLAIAEMISSMSKPTVSLVLGGGHSIGVPLAVSAKRSFIVPTATMTIHPVRMNGLVVGVPQTMNYFDRMQERIIGFVSEQSGLPADRMRELMFKTGELSTDVGSVLTGEDAVREGLMDYLGGLSDALECLYDMIEKKDKRSAKRVRCQRYR